MCAYQVTNPATGQTEATYEGASDAEVQDAIERAHREFGKWQQTPMDKRVSTLRRVADLYDERADELANIIAREMGKPLAQGLGEIKLSSDIYRNYADNGPGFVQDEELTVASGGSAVVRTAPLGVILGVMPWNYPYYRWPASRLRTSSLAIRCCLSTRRAARSRPSRSSRSRCRPPC